MAAFSSPFRDLMISQYKPLQAEGPYKSTETGYAAKDYSSGALPEYDAIRSRMNAQMNQTQGQSQDALDRQFAALGGGPSGSQIKQTENLAATMAKQRDQSMQDVNFQEAQQRRQLQQGEDQKVFQSHEAIAQRAFAGQEGVEGRNLQRDQFNFDALSKMGSLEQQWAALDQSGKKEQADRYAAAFNAAVEAKKNGDRSSIDYLINHFLKQGEEMGYLQ